ncbi:MAG: hypothetical protein R2712_20165 [Vicinamibacterales bacterium]
MKVAIVVQRYGADINGGAELHARYVAEHLARHVEVEVLTTCASDYITWRNERAEGQETVHGVPVRRFPVSRERNPEEFAACSARVFTRAHSVRDELAWLDAEGPTSPALIEFIRAHEQAYDFFVFFSVRYYHAYHGARAVPGKAILVPTAERDAAVGLGVFGPIFRGVRAIMYNSMEERALIQAVSNNGHVPGVVVGVGSDIPDRNEPARFRQKFDFPHRFAVYVGRIDENKGCRELFDFFENYSASLVDGLHLVLIGNPVIPVPRHPRIHHLGFVSDQDKFDAIAAAEVLVMPSYFEPVDGGTRGMGPRPSRAGQCGLRRAAGTMPAQQRGPLLREFPRVLRDAPDARRESRARRDARPQRRRYFEQHYSWPVIERRVARMFERLQQQPATHVMERIPGWWSRRRATLAGADEVVSHLPRGAAREVPAERLTEPTPRSRPARPSTSAPTPSPAVDRRGAQPRSDAGVQASSGARRPAGRDGGRRSSGSRGGQPRAETRQDRGSDARRPRQAATPPPPETESAPPAERQTGSANGERQPGSGSGDRRRRPMRGRRRPGGPR